MSRNHFSILGHCDFDLDPITLNIEIELYLMMLHLCIKIVQICEAFDELSYNVTCTHVYQKLFTFVKPFMSYCPETIKSDGCTDRQTNNLTPIDIKLKMTQQSNLKMLSTVITSSSQIFSKSLLCLLISEMMFSDFVP